MLLGLDLGTGSVKALLMDEDGATLGEGSTSYPVRSPRPGWAESSPGNWWSAVVDATRDAVGSRGAEVAAIGLSGQMHGVVLTEGHGYASRPAVLWADSRSREQLAAYRGLDEDARARLANPPAVGMAGPTLLWLRDHEPEVYASARWALQPKDWLRLRLTGEDAAEPSDASATLLYDLRSDTWDYPVVEALGLRPGLLARLVASADAAGTLTREAAEHLGLRAGLVQLTVGTGGQIVAPKSELGLDPHLRTHLYRAAVPDLWYSMAAIQNAGLALEWARQTLGATWDDVYEEAFAVPPGAGGVVFLPYLSGERTPRFDPDARGAWAGLGLDHGRGHLLRAALEGVAFALREGLEALEEAGTRVSELRLAGGGTVEESWRQLLADVLGRPLRVLPGMLAAVASARGAALLAGAASGVYRSPEDTLALAPNPDRTVRPGEASGAYEEAYARYRELYPRLYR